MTTHVMDVRDDDLVTLAEFVEFWWARDVPWDGLLDQGDRYEAFIHRKQSAVRMLRKNHGGFPAPVGSRGKAHLFRFGDLAAWEPLRSIAEARAHRDGSSALTMSQRLERTSPRWILNRAWRACARWMDPDTAELQIRQLCVALTFVLHLLRNGQTAESVRMYGELTEPGSPVFEIIERSTEPLAASEPSEPNLGSAVRLLADLKDRELLEAHPDDQDRLVMVLDGLLNDRITPSELVEVVLQDLEAPTGFEGESFVTPPGLTRLVIAAADPQPEDLILDPACGEGDLLLAASQASHGAATLFGVERDPLAWAVAVVRLALWGVPADITLGTYPEAVPGPIKADLVLANPPIGSRKQYITWLQRSVDSLNGGGRAAVVLPALTLDTVRREWSVIGRRRASAVVRTPSRMRSDTNEALAVWLLDREPSDDILVIDASEFGRRRDQLTRFSVEEAELVGQTVQRWRQGVPLPGNVPTKVISRDQLGRSREPGMPEGQPLKRETVLGLIFLKYLSVAFERRRLWLEGATMDPSNADYYVENPDRRSEIIERKAEYAAGNVLWVPIEARWEYLKDRAGQPDFGAAIDIAIDLVEGENPQLKGVLPKSSAYREIDPHLLGKLVELFDFERVTGADRSAEEVLGHVYGYFLERFASAEGKAGGVLYTPRSVVQLLVEMLEPRRGNIYDPCCGSGSTLVQVAEFVAAHGGKQDEVSIYGQEHDLATWRLAKMNLAIQGIQADLGSGPEDSFRHDIHPELRADFVITRPPFNQNTGTHEHDPRWRYGRPPASSGNYAWLQHVLHHLSPQGIAGIALANGSLSSKSGGEDGIRKNLLEANVVDCIVALPDKLFFESAIPTCLWFLARSRSSDGFRERTGETLFIDAREFGEMTDRKFRVLPTHDIARIASTYHSWRDKDPEVPYEDIPGFCKAASLEEVAVHDFVLTPGRYVGASASDDIGEPPWIEEIEANLLPAIERVLKMAGVK